AAADGLLAAVEDASLVGIRSAQRKAAVQRARGTRSEQRRQHRDAVLGCDGKPRNKCRTLPDGGYLRRPQRLLAAPGWSGTWLQRQRPRARNRDAWSAVRRCGRREGQWTAGPQLGMPGAAAGGGAAGHRHRARRRRDLLLLSRSQLAEDIEVPQLRV